MKRTERFYIDFTFNSRYLENMCRSLILTIFGKLFSLFPSSVEVVKENELVFALRSSIPFR